jgi:hypothetical protein
MRPYIAYAVGKLAQYASNPSAEHQKDVNRIFRYVKSTLSYGITYHQSAGGLRGYTDACWSDHDNLEKRSTSGYLFLLAGGPISWSSKSNVLSLHPPANPSISERRYQGRGLADELLVGSRPCSTSPTTVYGDNQGAIALVNNLVYHGLSRHIDFQYQKLRSTR